jgi:Na+-driven multidrug efflux pump
VVSALLGLCIILARPLIFRIFVLSDTARDYLNFMLLVSSYYVVGQAMNTLVIAGVFRAGGDSKFGMICDSVTMWCIAVPLGFFCAFVLKVPVKVEYFILCLDEFWKMPVVYKNYKNYHWLKNITREYE